jgi:acyl transferase domain-containing protein/thioesterase domain-containing protein
VTLPQPGFIQLERVMLEGSNDVSPGDIAIVGMALRVPGANNVGEFWSNLRNGVESIRTLSAEELAAAGETDRLHHPNYVPRCADLGDMEMFDAEFFGLSPKEAAIMDPQHRHFLECLWEAVEDSGRIPNPGGEPVGVFAGCGMGSYFYFNVCSNRHLVDQVGMFLLRHTGNDKDFLSTRASFTFDLRGPSVNVQTACSTSLVAIHYACQSLLSGECDSALAGGVTIELPHRHGYTFNEGEILSPDGHCRPFDHRAAGTVFGSGVGVVMLRRLSDALKDGDIIHAVIKGTAINNDGGTKSGYLAPSVDGQAAAIVEAQGLAGVGADSIGYVECHGTGTFLGDPIEIEGLTQAFRQSTDRKGFCHVGSVKSNIGHLDTAAGVVGLIKAALVIKNGEIPPTLGFEKPNPSVDFAQSPFVVNNTLVPWPAGGARRRAAVNSLGVGGTNAHAILEQPPASYMAARASDVSTTAKTNSDPLFLLLTARQRKGLERAAERLSSAMIEQPAISLADVSHTLLRGRKHFEHRLVVPVRHRHDALTALADIERAHVHTPVESPAGAVFLFPGGGAQYPKMAHALYSGDKAFRASVDEGLSYLPKDVEAQVRDVWFGEDVAATAREFRRPSVQLPAILIVEVALARLWINWGIKPVALIGHSMGEYAAACISGVMSFRDAVSLVRLRGELFETVPKGGMLSVPLEASVLAGRLPAELDIASVNAPSLCVVSGLDADLDTFREALAADGIDASRIPIDIAAHSRLLESILAPFEAFLRKISLRHPTIPVISNRSGVALTASEAADPMYWVAHLRGTVRFAEGLATLAANPGHIYLEVGPGRVLSSLTKMQGSIPANQVINSLPHPEEAGDDHLHFLGAIGRAFATGLSVNVDRLWEGHSAKRVSLPSYPFDHRRYFIERSKDANVGDTAEISLSKEADLSQWGYRPSWKRSLSGYEQGAENQPGSWLFFLDEGGLGMRLATRLRALGHSVATVSLSDSFTKRASGDYTLCPELGRAGYDALLAGLAADGVLPTKVVHMWLVTLEEKFRPGSNFFHRNQECGFESLLHFAQAVGDLKDAGELQITIVTNGMQQVASEPLPYPDKATVLGPALVMPKEMPGTTVKLIDIDLPHMMTELGAAAFDFMKRLSRKAEETVTGRPSPFEESLWEEIHAPAVCETIALRGGNRWSRSRRRMPLPEIAAEQAKLRQNGVYFFAGGLSEVALALSGEFARRLQAKIVLVGRAVLPPLEQWDFYARTHGHDSVRRAIAAIRELQGEGAEVLYLTGDVTNFEEMTRAAEAATAHFGRIDGVFHAAGVIDDNFMQMKTHESIEQVLAPKVLGTTVLASVFESYPLDLFVMFSSTSTDIIRAGQVDYVAANAFLNAFAQSASTRTDRSTVAVHWGIWNEVGIAARAVGAAHAGVPSVSQVATAAGSLFQGWVEDEHGLPWLEAVIDPKTNWILNEHRLVSGQAVMPGTGYIELIAQAAREYGLPFEVEIADLVFLAPMVFAGDRERTIRVRLEPIAGSYRALVTAGVDNGAFARHAEAMIEARAANRALPLDIAQLSARCAITSVADAGSALKSVQEKHIRFGARWRVLQSMAVGQGEAVAELALNPAFAGDLVDGVLVHPALLDIATGFALALANEYDASNSLWAPATYESVTLHGPLPAQIVSWARLADDQTYGPGYAVFDIVIADRQGQVLFEARGFVMRRLEGDLQFEEGGGDRASASPTHKQEASSPARMKLASQVRNGILPAEGFEVLARALASSEPQPIVSSIDLDILQAWVDKSEAANTSKGEEFERPELDSEFVGPRNPVEETIAGYWRELLGIAQIGVHDNFFDVGGHSLIAVRLFRMIKGQYGLDLPISFLFEAPTIAQCAEHIMSQVEISDVDTAGDVAKPDTAAVGKPMHVVLLSEGKDKSATPLFICAGMFGNVLNLRHIAVSLSADRPIYGLQARGLYGDHEPHETFEEMARDYIAEIRVVQPHGPYILAGYSGGGICAYEMAHQLLEMGEEVAHLVMLDTPLPRQPGLQWRDKVEMKFQDLNRYRTGLLVQWLNKRRRWKETVRNRAIAAAEQVSGEQFNNLRIEQVFRSALLKYEVRPYSGALTLFRPKPNIFYTLSGNRHLQENRNVVLADNGWTPYVSNLEISEVPGDHDSMVLDPYARVLASRIRAILTNALKAKSPKASTAAPARAKHSDPEKRALTEHV